MKKINMLIASLLAMLPMMHAFGTSYYYAKTTAKPGIGCGKVYASTNSTLDPTKYVEVDSTSDQQGGKNKSATEYTFYVFAQNKYGYKFKAWESLKVDDNQTDKKGSATISNATTEKGALVKVKTGTKSFSYGGTQNTTASVTATYEACTDADPHYMLTMGNNTGTGSYKFSGTVDFPSITPSESARVWFNDVVSISATPAEGFDFVRWCREDANGKSYYTDVTLANQSFTSDTTISAEFKPQVVCHALCLASEGGTYKAGTETVSGSDVDVHKFGEVSVTMSNPIASEEYEFFGWFKLHENGIKEYLSYYPSAQVNVTAKEDVTVGAEFRRKADVTLTFQPTEGIVYTVAGSKTVDGDVYVMDNRAVGSKEVALSISSTIDKQPRWWYKGDEFSEKVYFAYDKSATKTFTASAIVGVDLVHSDKSLAKVLDGVESGTVTLTSDAEVLDGTAVTIPAGVEVVVPEGKTLYVDGSLTVNGTLTVNGSVSKCLKLIKQSGEDGLRPVNPYGSVKYWKSAKAVSSTASVNNWSGTIGDHLTVMRGDGVAVRGAITSTTKFVECSFDGNVAVNHVTGIGTASSSTSLAESKCYILLADATMTGPIDKDNSRLRSTAKIDCAGNKCSETYKETHSSHHPVLLNASVIDFSPSSYWQNSAATFYNCPSITIKKLKNTPVVYLYDSGKSLTFTQYDSSGYMTCNFYSGLFDCNLANANSLYINSADKHESWIYGGGFLNKPNDKWIETETKKTHAFCQHADGYWYLDVKQDTSVAKIGATPYYTIDAALDYLNEYDSATITLLRDVTLDQVYTLNKGKSLVVELNGCRINAPNGFVVNSGVLSIRDKDNRLSGSGITVGENANVVENLADGAVDICYGAYTGNFVNSGTFTTHHGKFTGSITNNGGTMNLNGGVFSTDVSPLLNKGYHAFSYNGLYYVGRFPRPELGESSLGGFAHTLKAMLDVDATLYRTKKTYSLESCSNIEEWRHVAELKAAYSLFADDFYFDILGGFDRDIQADTVSAKVKVGGLSPSEGFPAMTAGEMDRLFTPRITQTKISYARFIYDNGEGVYDNLEAAVSDDGSNKGTTCTLAMDLWKWHDSKKKDYIVSYLTILKKTHVFGAGSNKAMLQTAAGAVPDENFFATLAAAIASETTTGKTIKLCNDCNDCNEQVTVTKACTIDPNGFEFSGTLTAGEGLSMKTANGVYVFKAPDPVDQVNVENVVSEEWLAANEIDTTNASSADIQAAVQEVLKETDANGNAKWENLVIGQKADEAAAVTAANGGTETTVDVAVTFEVPKDKTTGDKIDTGYTVTYAFDKVDETVEGGVVKGEAKDKPTLDIESVKAEDGPAYFKMRAVLEASDDSNVTAEVPVEKTIGVVKVASDAEVTIIPVPWQSLGDTDIKATELVHAASLSNDDELIVYGADGKSQTWIVQNGEWTAPVAEYTIGGGDSEPQQGESQDPAELKRGQGVILKRKDTNKEIVLIGQPVANETEKVETPIAAATSSTEPSWNLVASPKMEAVAVADVASDNTSDEIIVPTAGTPKHYTYKNGDWGYPGGEVTEEVNHPALGKIKVIKTEHKTGDTTINAGTGFWYLNKGTSKSINW